MKKIYCSIGLLAFIGMKAQVFEEVTPSPFKNSYYSSIAVGDYNNDGYKDVFFAGALDTDNDNDVDTTINELYKNNNGVFELAQVIEDYPVHLSSVKFIDFDNDGLLDIIDTGLSYKNVVDYRHYRFKNNGSSFELVDNLPGKIYGNIDVFDFNHDGKMDYSLNGVRYVQGVGFTKYVDLYTNSKSGFTKEENWILGSQNGKMKAFDFNNDNELDAVVTGVDNKNNFSFFIYKNNGKKMELHSEQKGLISGDVTFADFNADGFLDIVVSGKDSNHDSHLIVLWNDGNGNFTESEIPNEGLEMASIDVGDLNNDGYYDFIIIGNAKDANSRYVPNINVFIYDPKGNNFSKFDDTDIYHLGSNGSIELVDYNNDNHLDIIATGFDWKLPDTPLFSKLFKNKETKPNEKPNPPKNLSATVKDDRVVFEWSGASDDKTPEKALRYEISVGSESGKSDIAKYEVTTPSWYLKKENLPNTIYWSIKSIDASKVLSVSSKEQVAYDLSVDDRDIKHKALYPNPVKDILNISTDAKVKSYKLTNMLGQTVKEGSLSGKEIDLSVLESGIYIIDIQLQNGENINQKIIKN
ncbi:MAG: T9SS type A sorting domain-containing protein [Bergeyella cardium]|uniref:T9SS type A sorting domain-containing protein n=1 Tax=Bergeyella cardium TaxID=1585976 RepID=UPI000EA30C88|nr:T9SS type A sorting domain-containing protein [Bergeyella cardium]